MTDEKRSGKNIALDHMTVSHLTGGLEKLATTPKGGKIANLTINHLKPKAQGSSGQGGSGGSSGKSGNKK